MWHRTHGSTISIKSNLLNSIRMVKRYQRAGRSEATPAVIDERCGAGTRGSVDDDLRTNLQALGDGFGGPAVTASVTASRCGHSHPSLANIGPRSGGRWDGCQQRSTPLNNNTVRVTKPTAS